MRRKQQFKQLVLAAALVGVPIGAAAQVTTEQGASIIVFPKVIADAEKHNRPIDYAPPDETRKVIRQIFTELTQPERAEIQHIILKAY